MARTPQYGLIRIAALDVRKRPGHRSELTSQLLMGEAVAVLDAQKSDWWQVENLSDGYRGWIRTWGLLAASRRTVSLWNQQALASIRAPFAELRATVSGGDRIGPLFWNTRVVPGRARGKLREIKLPDGRTGWVERSAVALAGDPAPTLKVRIESLLGTPYLWGGRTPLGIDCSGFSQQLMAEQGVKLPRDADQQFRAARSLDPKEPKKDGDLVFFGPPRKPVGHVGVMLGPHLYAHSRGTVRISSLDPRNKLWERDLDSQIRGIRRSNPETSLKR